MTQSAAFRICPKEMGYAVFRGQKLIFWQSHSYLCPASQIERRVIGDIVRCIVRFNIRSAVLDILSKNDESAQLKSVAKEAIRNQAIPIFEIPEQELLSSFGHPPLKTRQELRKAVLSIFPQFESSRFMNSCLDAAALGLYFETNRILSA